jgi:Helix-turn-helix domain
MATESANGNPDRISHADPGQVGQSATLGKEWLGLRQLTEYADISERTLRAWIYSRRELLPAAKVPGKVLVRKADFDRYLERHRVKPLHAIDLDGIVQEVLRGATYGR